MPVLEALSYKYNVILMDFISSNQLSRVLILQLMWMFPKNQKSLIDFRLSVNFMVVVYLQGNYMDSDGVLNDLYQLKNVVMQILFYFYFYEWTI